MISVHKVTVSIHPWDPDKFSVYWLYFPVAYHFSDVACSFLMGFHLTPATFALFFPLTSPPRCVNSLSKFLNTLRKDIGTATVFGDKKNYPLISQAFPFGFHFILFIYLFNLFIFLNFFLAVLGLRFCARDFSSCSERGPLFIAVRRPLTVAASLAVEHRLQTRRLSSCGSRALELRLSNYGSRAQLPRGMWDLPRPGLEPVSPALAGRISTTAPPGKPLAFILNGTFTSVFGRYVLMYILCVRWLYRPEMIKCDDSFRAVKPEGPQTYGTWGPRLDALHTWRCGQVSCVRPCGWGAACACHSMNPLCLSLGGCLSALFWVGLGERWVKVS